MYMVSETSFLDRCRISQGKVGRASMLYGILQMHMEGRIWRGLHQLYHCCCNERIYAFMLHGLIFLRFITSVELLHTPSMHVIFYIFVLHLVIDFQVTLDWFQHLNQFSFTHLRTNTKI